MADPEYRTDAAKFGAFIWLSASVRPRAQVILSPPDQSPVAVLARSRPPELALRSTESRARPSPRRGFQTHDFIAGFPILGAISGLDHAPSLFDAFLLGLSFQSFARNRHVETPLHARPGAHG